MNLQLSNKRLSVWLFGLFANPSRVKRKKCIFLQRGGVYSLDPPFNGWHHNIPTLWISLSWMTLSNLACIVGEVSPTSSRKIVPLLAFINRPSRRLSAPVNAPFSSPKSSDSNSVSVSAAQFTITSGWSLRLLLWCMDLAISSFPVPLSPVINTVASEGAIIKAGVASWIVNKVLLFKTRHQS